MTKINDPANLGSDLFGYKINYNIREGSETPNSDFADLKVKPKYNGNIAEVFWKTLTEYNEPLKRYAYTYDPLNRLSAGFYERSGFEGAKEYFEINEYDLNGNIKRLQRSAELVSGTTALKIDDLKYDYAGNRLIKVTEEQIGNSNGYPYLTNHNTIEYDNGVLNGNGNMTKHLDKGISSIQYNYLNLPVKINQNAQVTDYTYRANGIKVKKLFGEIETNYLDGFQYKSTKPSEGSDGGFVVIDPDEIAVMKLRIIPTAEGYYDVLQNQYIYNYTDHLGNVRLSYSDTSKDGVIQPRTYYYQQCDGPWSPWNPPNCIDYWKPGEIVEVNNYYPFGLLHNYTATTQNAYQYKYNGKELQETGMYDYGARFYMPDIGRWGVVDPLAEKTTRYSPYNYAFNNPLRFIDPDGRQAEDIIIRGKDKKEWRIETAGEDKVINVPLNLKENKTIDIGAKDVDSNRFAIGYTIQADLGVSFGAGANTGLEASVVQFTDKTYGGYNYVYAGGHLGSSGGNQGGLSGSVGASLFVAYNNNNNNNNNILNPSTFEGKTISAGGSADVKVIAGGGINTNRFSGTGNWTDKGWYGYSLGGSVGIGGAANLGSGNLSVSKTYLLNQMKPTAQRSSLDRISNAGSPIVSALMNPNPRHIYHAPQFD